MCRHLTAPTSAFSISCRSAILTKLSDSSVPVSSQLRRALTETKNRCQGNGLPILRLRAPAARQVSETDI
jgi:hypothetical protein